MTVIVLGIQAALPLAMLAWLKYLPAGSLVGYAIQAAASGAMLFAVARIAQWALSVWWLPFVYGALWFSLVLFWAVGKRPGGRPLLPKGAWGWTSLLLAVVLCAVGGWFGAQALMGRRMPPSEVVDIANPFGTGRYLVGNGGSNLVVNAHLKTLDASVGRFQPWRGQSYAVDFFGLGSFGLRADGWRPSDPSAYAIFGAELRAPCAGTVVAAEGRMPDFEVPELDAVNRLGNHVILRCGTAEIVLAHMRNGSIGVAPGDIVAEKGRLGEVGNSGASTEPHLHIHAQRPAAKGAPPISGEPLALRIDGSFLVRGDRLTGQDL